MEKWIAIMVIGSMAAIFGGGAVHDYSVNQCRTEALKALVKPELIANICK